MPQTKHTRRAEDEDEDDLPDVETPTPERGPETMHDVSDEGHRVAALSPDAPAVGRALPV